MRKVFTTLPISKGHLLGAALLAAFGSLASAQDAASGLGNPTGWQRYDWLGSPSNGASAEGQLTSTANQDISDPFAVVGAGSLWQEKYGATYVQPLTGTLSLSYETSAVELSEGSSLSPAAPESPDDVSHEEKAGVQFSPVQALTLRGDVHTSDDDAGSPQDSLETRGSSLSAETKLPLSSVLSLRANLDTADVGSLSSDSGTDNSYDAQIKQPLGKLPLTAVLKGHYEETTANGTAATRLPSMEQSLIWKPADSTTLQMGLRQQHYQNFPGVTNELNEALFADWSQTVLPEVTWHSYAEVLDTRGTQDVAPAAPATSGAYGTAQSADPTNSLGLPTSVSDETITFSTGPSFKLQRDLSASVEYSNRIDRNPLPGDVGQEQRVSVSLKGSF